jgi:hypothetical protein
MASSSHLSSVRTGLLAHRRRGALALTAAAAACLALAGCGGGSSSTSSAPANPLATLTAKQIVTKSVADLRAAKSFTMVGSVTGSGQTESLNLGYLNGKGCAGTVTEGTQGSVAIVVIGTTAWIKPDNKFFESTAGSQASAAIALLNGRYLKGTTSNANVKSLTSVCDVTSLTSAFTATGTLVKGKVTTLNGQQVITVTDSAKGGTLYATNTATPQLVQIVNTKGEGGDTGRIKFNVGAKVTLTPPPASQTVDGAAFGF